MADQQYISPGKQRFSDHFKTKLKEHLNQVTYHENIVTVDELEFRLGTVNERGFSPKFRMPVFRRLVNYLQNKYPNKPGYPPQPTEEYQLDVSLNLRDYPQLTETLKKARIRITGRQNIQRFCRTDDLPLCQSFKSKSSCEEDEECMWVHPDGPCRSAVKNKRDHNTRPVVKVEAKSKQEQLIMEEYDIRIQSSQETEITSRNTVNRIWELVKKQDYMKFYRYKKRYSWTLPNVPIRFDLSVVKEASGRSFELANVLNAREKYEIEIEYLEKIQIRDQPNVPVSPEHIDRLVGQIYNHLFEHLAGFIKEYQETYEIMSNSEMDKVVQGYSQRIGYPGSPFFIGMDLVSIQTRDLLPDPKTRKIPILEKWVTPKADGVRHLVYVYDGEDPAYQGNIYILNNRLKPKATGVKSQLTGVIADSEFIVLNNGVPAVLVFDAFFQSSLNLDREGDNPTGDIRKQKLADRLKYIDLFLQENNIQYPNIPEGPEMERGVQIQKKVYHHLEFTPTEYQELAKGNQDMSSPLGWNKVFLERDWDFPLDGLIFASGGPYPVAQPRESRRWEGMFKWKPLNQLSNDFLVSIKHDARGNDQIFTDRKTNTRHKLLILKNFIFEHNQKTLVKFSGSPPFRDNIDNVARVPIEADGTIKTREDRHIIYDNSVIEFIWEGGIPPRGGWVPLRFREDKTDIQKPNHLDTARSNWKQIVNPITEKMITGEEQVPVEYYAKVDYNLKNLTRGMRSFHNKIKRELLERASMSARILPNRDNDQILRLLDLGAGQGGDLQKWMGNNPDKPLFDFILAVEYNLSNLTKSGGAIERYKVLQKRTKTLMDVRWIYGDGTRNLKNGAAGRQDSTWGDDGNRLQNLFLPHNLGSNAFDVVSCQFTVHYFFKEINSVNNFFYNVYQNLRDGGYLIGTTLMGSQVMQLLEGLQIDQGVTGQVGGVKIWEIIRRYVGEEPLETGQEIAVFNSSINGEAMAEYLVHFVNLADIARKFGLIPISELDSERQQFGPFHRGLSGFAQLHNDSEIFSKFQMSEDEQKYSFLNGYFIFKFNKSEADAAYIQNFATNLVNIEREVDHQPNPIETKVEAELEKQAPEKDPKIAPTPTPILIKPREGIKLAKTPALPPKAPQQRKITTIKKKE